MHGKFGLLLLAAVLGIAPLAGAETVLWEDTFDGSDPIVNEGGVGAGYSQYEFHNDATAAGPTTNAVEAGGVLTTPTDAIRDANAGNNANWIATDATFDLTTATPITLTMTFTEMQRVQTNTGQTGRFFSGFVKAPVKDAWVTAFGDTLQAAADNSYLEALWVMFHGRVNWGTTPTLDGVPNKGALIHIEGAGGNPTVTVLEEWSWDPSVFVFDNIANAGGRVDRVSMDLIPPDITFNLTADATGYELSFSTTGSATLPGTMTGTWAAKGVPNNFSSVKAMPMNLGRFTQQSIDLLKVTAAGNGAPEITPVNQQIAVDIPVTGVKIATVTDDSTAAANIQVTATSSSTDLAVSNVAIDANGDVTADLSATAEGNFTIAIAATDDDATPATGKQDVTVIATLPRISANLRNEYIDEGTIVILSAPAGNTFQWKLNGTDIPGETGQELVFDPVLEEDAGDYTVDVDGFVTPKYTLAVKIAGTVPAAGFLGLAALAGICGLAGARRLSRKNKR